MALQVPNPRYGYWLPNGSLMQNLNGKTAWGMDIHSLSTVANAINASVILLRYCRFCKDHHPGSQDGCNSMPPLAIPHKCMESEDAL